MYEGCPESIQQSLISWEPIKCPGCNLAASHRRSYLCILKSHSPVGVVSRQWDAVDWACVLFTYNVLYNWCAFVHIQGVPGGKVNILGGHSIGHYKQKTYMYMCPIPNGFRDRDISLYNCLNLALSSVLSSRRTAPLSKACVYQASVDCCNWPMWRPSSIVQNAVHLHKCWIY